ncbi:protein STRUBBELIG-like isoform X2 [Pistacia vera]|uniref:protein STRUBBELIG-like isoform X2 n=1 Tax=Pistacia vera TaxID=55513 RepID=UPI001262BD00|nr:protein STRUBBELIG-like isoform X2 [Pistacia vera]
MGCVNYGVCVGFGVVVFTALTAPFCAGLTDPRDVAAINSLYVALDFPPLDKWLPLGGDPCGDSWQGVLCVFSNVTEIRLNGMNLGGTLVDSLGDFKSIIVLDLSNNHIGGSIPNNLPLTIRNFSLSGNQFTGSIPESLALLSQLLDLSLGNNHMTGGIPDAFQQLTGLINLDLSANNLSGQLPPSTVDLSSLNTLHLQNNTLSGLLDVLQDLHLTDLNIENNLFSGPIPTKLLAIPNFRKGGNPFNTTIIPSPSTALSPSIAWAPSPGYAPGNLADVPSISIAPKFRSSRKFWTTKGVIGISITGAAILFVLGACLFVCRYCRDRKVKKDSERNDVGAYKAPGENPNNSKSSLQPSLPVEKVSIQPVSKEPIMKPQDGYGVDNRRTGINPKPQDEQLPPPPFPLPLVEKVTVKPLAPAEVTRSDHPSTSLNSGSTIPFTIATLQQCTNSFSEENFIGEGMLGSVYIAELPDGKLVAVKKVGITASRQQSDDEFLGLVSRISKLQHPNIVNLVGYCNEHRQHLLVYEYCGNGTLHDLLHVDEENHKKLSWNMRIRMALGAARALQYLHEGCQPPIVHRNFKSANILLDEKLAVHVSDCGLDLLLSGSTTEFSGRYANGYGAPELESGSYTCQSDVYSLGVVMLELLTGRKSYDRSRPRGEHSLVRWAIPQLHDIDALSKMVDPSLNGAYPVKSLSRFADIISRCVQWEPGFRPPMSEIVQDLLQMI